MSDQRRQDPEPGRTVREGAWSELGQEGRRQRLTEVQERYFARHEAAPDAPAGRTCVLDGRHVTDRSALFLALGEAVNGPGGYFGADLDALNDCLRGGFGATAPFTLVWQDSATARTHLMAYFDSTLDVLAEHGVDVRLG
ncbi:barstar family protein [Streptomyces sp. NPDC004111]|uniref:barstar family protein n=1 Tax=Streptomyces sp. NPDC004111 TaxID=3364690 RepID=UPI0036C4849E